MIRNRWLFSISAFVLIGSVGRVLLYPIISRGADRRIAADDLFRIEQETGKHLYAPTWLPEGGHVGEIGILQGANRMLQDFTGEGDRPILIIAQETRTAERDSYHRRLFETEAGGRTTVRGKPAFLVTGSSGERRLFWNEKDTAIILSTMALTDNELRKIGESMR
ncbi:MAG: hypothetical protein ACO1SX_27110 [Actinomycetota bacterium]